jgi:glutamyl-Q tRNA(Asp) synthetase
LRKELVFACGPRQKSCEHLTPARRPVYPGTRRSGLVAGRRPRALRIRVPDDVVCFADGLYGSIQQCLAMQWAICAEKG